MVLCVIIIKTDSGGGEVTTVKPDNDDASDDWKVKDRPFPKCEAVASSGGLPTWMDLLKNVEKAYSKTADSLKDIQGDIDPKLRVYTQLQVSTLFEQVFACLPQYISQPEEHYDDYMEDKGGNEEHEMDDSKVVTGLVDKVKQLIAKMKGIFKTGYDNWETKDSIIQVSSPSVFCGSITLDHSYVSTEDKYPLLQCSAVLSSLTTHVSSQRTSIISFSDCSPSGSDTRLFSLCRG